MMDHAQLKQLLSKATKRTHMIVALKEAFVYDSYLEIGCRKDETFSEVSCSRKIGVDPIEGGNVRLLSDDFFALNKDTFDLIFIDGDHHHDQVLRDVLNALNCLAPGGTVVMHDCSPPDAAHEGKRDWKCGTAWRAYATLRARPDLDMVVADWDYGSGVIRKAPNPQIFDIGKPMDDLTYADFELHRQQLRLMDQETITDWVWEHLNRSHGQA
jgi:hypothetical protein